MNLIKNIACALAFAAVAACMAQPVRAAEKTFGISTGYISRNESMTAALFFEYRFAQHFRLTPSVGVAFRNEHRDAFLIDVDAQFPFEFGRRFEFYPIVGANYTSWAYHHQDMEPRDGDDDGDVTTRHNKFGINAGAGLGFNVSQSLKLFLQARGTFVKANSGARISVGIGYRF